MRSLFGVLSLLVALAVVLFVARGQLQAVVLTAPSASASPPSAAPATVQETARGAQQKVQQDVTRALEQGAARASDAQP